MPIDTNGLKNSVDIVALVGSYVELKRRGSEYVGLCVNHDDHSPSMWVNPEKRFVHCFSCGFNADAIAFVQYMEHCDFKEAAEKLGATEWKPKRITSESKPKPSARITEKPPRDVARPNLKHSKLGDPVAVYDINDTNGELIAVECRYMVGGIKAPRMWSWSKSDGWQCKHPSVLRPLFGLDRLAQRPNAPVLLTEGPKCAEAGTRLLPAMVNIAWTGGSRAWRKHDWSPLAGRTVVIWPDNDEGGIEAADGIAHIIADARGNNCSVKIINPDGMAPAWDVADAETEGMDKAAVLAWAKPRAVPFASAGSQSSPAVPESEPSVSQGRESVTPPEASSSGLGSPADTDTNISPSEFPPEASITAPVKRARRGPPPLRSVPSGGGGEAVPAPAPDPGKESTQPLSDDDMAQHLVENYGENWRYVAVRKKWFEWMEGDGWHEDQTKRMNELCVRVTRQALNWPEGLAATPATRVKVNSKPTAGNIREQVSCDYRIRATVEQWNADPLLLGVPGGVIDLRTGKLIEAAREQFITYRTSIPPVHGPCPHWFALLDHVTVGDQDLKDYIHRWAGYLLTGLTREECLFFGYGPAAAGKSTFVRVLGDVLGDYHKAARLDQFTESPHEGHAERWAVLAGARMVSCSEIDEGKRWKEATIKSITGRDKIRCNLMHENSFEYAPQFKLVIAGNHAPHLRSVDEAMRRRLHIMPFANSVPVEDRDLMLADKLKAEYPQILHWAIQGCLAWQDAGLGKPEAISLAVDTYMQSEDSLGEWINERCKRDQLLRVQTSAAYTDYKYYAEAAGEHAPSQKRFTGALRERGFDTSRSSGTRYISGLTLLNQGQPPRTPYSD